MIYVFKPDFHEEQEPVLPKQEVYRMISTGSFQRYRSIDVMSTLVVDKIEFENIPSGGAISKGVTVQGYPIRTCRNMYSCVYNRGLETNSHVPHPSESLSVCAHISNN